MFDPRDGIAIESVTRYPLRMLIGPDQYSARHEATLTLRLRTISNRTEALALRLATRVTMLAA